MLYLFLSYHGDGDPHSEAKGEVVSVRDATFTNRQALTRGKAWLCHHCVCWGGENLSGSVMLFQSRRKKQTKKPYCVGVMFPPGVISADGPGLCSQRGCWPRKRVSTLLFFLQTALKLRILTFVHSNPRKASCLICVQTVSVIRFSTELNSGLLEVISPPAAYYPDLNNLKETFGDSKERVR